MADIQNSLEKLKALSEDDKNENNKLRSRIDEQCQLIMILKQRADEGTIKIFTLEKINKELLEFKEQTDSMLKIEIQKYHLLEGRFDSLASNHEEMIRIKDEYKRVNQELREKNAFLKEENDQLFSKTITEKDNIITEMNKKYDSLTLLEQKQRQSQIILQSTEETLRRKISELEASNSEQVKHLLKQLEDTKERLKGAEHKLQLQLESAQKIEEQGSEKLQRLSREKEELLDLVMQRGKLVQKEQEENTVLKKKIKGLENAVRDLENKFIHESEAVNANLRVKNLTSELQGADRKFSQLFKEFEAFKKHSNDLLKQEKELNDRLRQLYA